MGNNKIENNMQNLMYELDIDECFHDKSRDL